MQMKTTDKEQNVTCSNILIWRCCGRHRVDVVVVIVCATSIAFITVVIARLCRYIVRNIEAKQLSTYRSIWFTHKLEFQTSVKRTYFLIYANNVLNFNEAYALMNLIYIKHITRQKGPQYLHTYSFTALLRLSHSCIVCANIFMHKSIVDGMVLHSLHSTWIESNRVGSWFGKCTTYAHSNGHCFAIFHFSLFLSFFLCLCWERNATDTGVFASN